MADEAATITYSISQPFEEALPAVRRALSSRGLKLSGELNISSRIRQKLLIGTAPCVVLLISPSAELGNDLASDPCGTGLAPLHVVVSGRGTHSEVHLLNTIAAREAFDRRSMTAVNQLQAEILQAVERIGIRVSLTT